MSVHIENFIKFAKTNYFQIRKLFLFLMVAVYILEDSGYVILRRKKVIKLTFKIRIDTEFAV